MFLLLTLVTHHVFTFQEAADDLREIEIDQIVIYSDFIQHVPVIQRIWDDRGIQQCYDRRREYQLSDSTR